LCPPGDCLPQKTIPTLQQQKELVRFKSNQTKQIKQIHNNALEKSTKQNKKVT
jgi:hypothetical protein